MSGCGKFDEIIFIQYLDYKLEDSLKNELEDHLQKCDICSNELIELNRVNAIMDIGSPIQIPHRVIIKIKLKENSIFDFQSNFPGILTNQLATRSHQEHGQGFRMNIPMQMENGDELPATLNILPASKNLCWLIIDYDLLESEYIELNRQELNNSGQIINTPIFLKRAEGPSVTIKGLLPGKYQLVFIGNTLDIEIEQTE